MPNRKQHRGLSVPARPVPPADARRIVYVCRLRCGRCAARNTIRWMSDTTPAGRRVVCPVRSWTPPPRRRRIRTPMTPSAADPRVVALAYRRPVVSWVLRSFRGARTRFY